MLSTASTLSAPSKGAGQTRSAQLQLPDAPELVRDRSGAFLHVRFSKVTLREADAHLLDPYELHAQLAPSSQQQRQAQSSLSRPAAAAQRNDAAALVRASRAGTSAADALPPAMAARAAAPETDEDVDEDDAIEECYLQVRSGQPLESGRWQYLEKSALLIARNYSTRVLPVALESDGSRFTFLTRCIRHPA